jgi:hypothetical protein
VLDLLEEFQALLKVLDQARVDYAVCGGLAVAIHARPRGTPSRSITCRSRTRRRETL